MLDCHATLCICSTFTPQIKALSQAMNIQHKNKVIKSFPTCKTLIVYSISHSIWFLDGRTSILVLMKHKKSNSVLKFSGILNLVHSVDIDSISQYTVLVYQVTYCAWKIFEGENLVNHH